MNRVICMLIALLLCCAMALPVAAAKSDDFVPSIAYKDGPVTGDVILEADGEEMDVSDCVIITTLEQADEQSTDISQEDRDLLEEVYTELTDGDMELPLTGDYVISDLFDLSFKYEGCTEDDEHGHKDSVLKEDGNILTITFDLDIDPNETIYVFVFIDNEWVPVKAVNNGDGTLTCEFEEICPVAICREVRFIPQTGDPANSLILWVAVLVCSAAAVVGLIPAARKNIR